MVADWPAPKALSSVFPWLTDERKSVNLSKADAKLSSARFDRAEDRASDSAAEREKEDETAWLSWGEMARREMAALWSTTGLPDPNRVVAVPSAPIEDWRANPSV
jgi:hypothetical protein